MRTPFEDIESKLLAKQIQALNKHLPRERKTLAELLKEEKPSIVCRDGSTHRFIKEELRKLSSLLPTHCHNKLRLPIYIELGPTEFGTGIAKIRGEEECKVVNKILGVKPKGDKVFIYRPDIRKLRKELPTTTQYAFTLLT